MPDNQQVLALRPEEWRALAMLSLQATHAALENTPVLNDEMALEVQAMLARTKQLVEAWRRTSPKQPTAPNGQDPRQTNLPLEPTPNRHERRRRNKVSPPVTN